MANIAFNGTAFDPNLITPYTGSNGKLPVGLHRVMIVNSEVTQTKSGNGGFLALTMRVIDGECAGQEGIERVNLWNSNETAVDIAKRTLSTICHVTNNLSAISDTVTLHEIPFIVFVEKVMPKLGEEDRNDTRIAKWYNNDGVGPLGSGRADMSRLGVTPAAHNDAQGSAQASAPAATQTMTTPSDWGQQQQAAAPQQQAQPSWGQAQAPAQQQQPTQPAQQPQQTAAVGWNQPQQQQQVQASPANSTGSNVSAAPFNQAGSAGNAPDWAK